MTYPNDDDAILYLFTLIVKRHGWTFIDSLVSQNVTWLRGTGTPSELIAKPISQNELAASFAASPSAAAVILTKLPTEDHYVTWPQTAAIFATTKMPETAKLFMSYIMSDEWQADGFPSSGYATRKQFDTDGVLNQTLTNPLGFVTFMQDRANVERWRFQFETTLGTPQGDHNPWQSLTQRDENTVSLPSPYSNSSLNPRQWWERIDQYQVSSGSFQYFKPTCRWPWNSRGFIYQILRALLTPGPKMRLA
ncbi:uncharacterized protein LACBIDRAFT_336261 [Laccaria bicolor S238N-H82]|uniref:Predicted protein n=1 Tax=Laccaria bicolor (strain S238N-H82 / ATCC MYA-4686) TaxID=486041 RepID=B0E4X0_LACBS|nr:uncharacterized protein LACBIDRAFT_336261 [Laccaria bicolor S238N-H82]EDQ98112.1 predicted protein [Laccaria bicolor S238N-H82]|eukprot:XP_001891238.1 predicted protein [Laccaria bicolor S238N-H82]